MPHKIARTYQFETSTIERLTALARRLETYPGPLVELLLLRALGEVESGRWELYGEPIAYRPKWRDSGGK